MNWYLNKSVEQQFNSFAKGFYKVLSGFVISMMSGEEI